VSILSESFSSISIKEISLDSLLLATERSINSTLTIHDPKGIFREIKISNKWFHHRHIICKHNRHGPSDIKCLKNCQQDVGVRSESSNDPFKKVCWKKLLELVVPIYREDKLQFIIFIGPFRATKHHQIKSLSDEYQKLTKISEHHSEHLVQLLQFLGMSICEYLESHAFPNQIEGERKSIVRKFIFNNATEEISLGDLAKHLFLSTSRTSHLVTELFQKSYSELIKEERIKRACSILRNSRKPIKQIPPLIGIDNEYYFYRLFKKEVGMTPKKYRDQSGPGTTESIV